MASSSSSEDSETEDALSSDDEDPGVQTHPFTLEQFTGESISNIPEYKEFVKTLGKCSDPGHSCMKYYRMFMNVMYNDGDTIPREKIPVRCISRKVWGAAPPTAPPERPSMPILKVVFYYDVGMKACLTEDQCKKSVRELQRRQMEEDGLSDIGFNFVVGGDMNVYEGRGFHAQPDESHKYPQWRHRRVDVAFITPILKNVRSPDHDWLMRIFDFFRVAIMNFKVHFANDFYEIKDHYKSLVRSPPIPVQLCTGEEVRENMGYLNMPDGVE